MPYSYPPYKTLEKALKAKQAVFSQPLVDAIEAVARAKAASDSVAMERAVEGLKPHRRANVLAHASDLVCFFTRTGATNCGAMSPPSHERGKRRPA